MQSCGSAINVNSHHASCVQPIRALPAAKQFRSGINRRMCMCSCTQETQTLNRRQIAASIVTGTMAVALMTGQPAQAAGQAAKSFATTDEEKPLAEKYQNSSSKKAMESSKRKAELSRKRAQRVAAGGAADGETDGATAKQTSEAANVDKATREAEESNATRAAEAERMMAAIRSKAEGYGDASKSKVKTNY